MNVQSIIARSLENKETMKRDAEKAREEKIQRIIEAVSEKAMKMAQNSKITYEWMNAEAVQLKEDVKLFLADGEEFIEEGCSVFFGPTGVNAVAYRDFGTYVLSLEKSIEGSYFPRTLKVFVRAHTKLAKMLSRRLNVESISLFGVNELLKAEKDGKLPIDFVAPEDLPSVDTEVIELGKTTMIIGRETVIDVDVGAVVHEGKVLCFRTDWYSGKESAGFVFDLRHVYQPRT